MSEARRRSDRGLRVTALVAVVLVAGGIAAWLWVWTHRHEIYTAGPSMNPTMRGIGTVEIDHDAFDGPGGPGRGEIVALQAPANHNREYCGVPIRPGQPCARAASGYSRQRLVKRVVGLPGDRIAFDRRGRLILNGRLQREPYIRPCVHCPLPVAVTVPPDRYFVAGDNRRRSSDSRLWGSVPADAIDGRVIMPPGGRDAR